MTERLFNSASASSSSSASSRRFVAAFANSNLGDVSPNLKGPKCQDTGLPCDYVTSTCSDGKSTKCWAAGPGKDMFESTRIIGQRQADKAMELYRTAKVKLTGPIFAAHRYVDMSAQRVRVGNVSSSSSSSSSSPSSSTRYETTCKPAMGMSFAAGTTDGPGSFDFRQGSTNGNAFWEIIRNILSKPSEEMRRCQHPKPILLPTGEMTFPYLWQV